MHVKQYQDRKRIFYGLGLFCGKSSCYLQNSRRKRGENNAKMMIEYFDNNNNNNNSTNIQSKDKRRHVM